MAQSITELRYQELKSEVCIPHTLDSRYAALRRTLMFSTDDLAKVKINSIIDITNKFTTALKSEQKKRYCGDGECKTLPFMTVDFKGNEVLTRSFIPTAYHIFCLLYTSPSPRDGLLSRMPSSA